MTPTNNGQADHHHYTDEEMHNEDVAYEHSDVQIGTLLAFGGGILAIVAFAALLMYGLFITFEKQAAGRDPHLSPVAARSNEPPQGPELLRDEPANLRRFRQEEAGKLEGAGWMNQGAGVAHVPIEVAKKLILVHGLATRAGAGADAEEGTNAPAYGEASGGRTIPVTNAPAANSGQQAPPPAPQPAGQEIKK
jgi:hypothetical protein